MIRVRLSANARDYLRKETAYLRRHSSAAAKRFVDRLAEARRNLSSFPELGVEVSDLPIEGMRRLIVGEYILDYEITPHTIDIVAIRSGLQAPPDFEEDDDDDFEDR